MPKRHFRSETVTVRVSPREKMTWNRASDSQELSLAEWVREVVNDHASWVSGPDAPHLRAVNGDDDTPSVA